MLSIYFQSRLTFEVKATDAFMLPPNVGLGRIVLLGTNTLAYLSLASVTKKKKKFCNIETKKSQLECFGGGSNF